MAGMCLATLPGWASCREVMRAAATMGGGTLILGGVGIEIISMDSGALQ